MSLKSRQGDSCLSCSMERPLKITRDNGIRNILKVCCQGRSVSSKIFKP